MSFVTEKCTSHLTQMAPSAARRRARSVFRDDAHLDYYGLRPRTAASAPLTVCSSTNRTASSGALASDVFASHASSTNRKVDVGAMGDERDAFFTRQFKFKPKKRPSVEVASLNAFLSTLKDIQESDSCLQSALEIDVAMPSRNGRAEDGTSEFYSGPRNQGKGKGRRLTEAFSMASRSSSDSSCSSDDETKPSSSGRLVEKKPEARGCESLVVENSAVPAPHLRSSPHSVELEAMNIHMEETETKSGTLLVCQGKGCSKRGAGDVFEEVIAHESSLGFDVVGCKCLKMCKQGPVVVKESRDKEFSKKFTAVNLSNVDDILNTF